jgi:hypothetical protein
MWRWEMKADSDVGDTGAGHGCIGALSQESRASRTPPRLYEEAIERTGTPEMRSARVRFGPSPSGRPDPVTPPLRACHEHQAGEPRTDYLTLPPHAALAPIFSLRA